MESPTAFDWLTFGIAIAGLSLAVIGLGWQVFSWTWTGSRVKVETVLRSGEVPADGGPTWVDFVEVTVRNKGRTAVDVTSWYVTYERDLGFSEFDWEPWQGPEVPVRLDAGQAVHWRILCEKLRDGFRVHDLPPDTELRGQVQLGTGQRRRSRNTITQHDHDPAGRSIADHGLALA